MREVFRFARPYAGSVTCSELHRHGSRVHAHSYRTAHRHVPGAFPRSVPLPHLEHDHPLERQDARVHGHDHDHADGRSHSHGLIDESIKRSRAGIRAVALSLAVLGAAALVQALVFVASGSVALLADLIHNGGDALTALPLALAFILGSRVAERRAGFIVVATIFVSACVAAGESVERLIHPTRPHHLLALACAGAIGCLGNAVAARIRTRTGERLNSAALTADGHHARADAYVSLAVVASALFVAAGVPIMDPLLGLGITALILRVTWEAWRTVRRAS